MLRKQLQMAANAGIAERPLGGGETTWVTPPMPPPLHIPPIIYPAEGLKKDQKKQHLTLAEKLKTTMKKKAPQW